MIERTNNQKPNSYKYSLRITKNDRLIATTSGDFVSQLAGCFANAAPNGAALNYYGTGLHYELIRNSDGESMGKGCLSRESLTNDWKKAERSCIRNDKMRYVY